MNFLKKAFFVLLILNLSSIQSKAVPDSFADLAEKLMPSVVNISTTQTVRTTTNQFPFQFPPGSPFGEMFKDFERPTERKASSLGSGFIIKADGIVITNNHVIANAEDILVRVGDKEYSAEVLGADPYMDLAVLKMKTNEKFKPVSFGDSTKARVGDWVVAIGNPFGLGGTVTSGIISAKNRQIGLTRYEDFIQTDASINQGNSGGPLFNIKGEVIGVNTAIIAPGQSGSIGIGFAIPSNAASNVIDQLIKFGETKRGWLGVRIQEVTKEIAEVEKLKKPEGALVASVGQNSPAEKAGIKADCEPDEMRQGGVIIHTMSDKDSVIKALSGAEYSIEEGNEFAQKVRELKAKGAKPGTKFKTSDGEEHTLESAIEAAGLDILEFWTEDELAESGIMYKAGVKKYGKEGMSKIQSAAGKGASASSSTFTYTYA